MDCYEAFKDIIEDFKYLLQSRESDVREFEDRLSTNLREETNAVRRLEQQVEVIRQELGKISRTSSSHAAGAGVCCRCATPLDVHDQFSREVRRHLLAQQQKDQQQHRDDIDLARAGPSWSGGSSRRDESMSRRRGRSETRGGGGGGILKNPLREREVEDPPSWRPFRSPVAAPLPRNSPGPSNLDYPLSSQSSTPLPEYQRGTFSPPHREETPEFTRGRRWVEADGSLRRDNKREKVRRSQEELEDRMRVLNDQVDRVTSKTHSMLSRTSYLNNTSRALKDQILGLQQDLTSINSNLR